jgi:hypothetical protein
MKTLKELYEIVKAAGGDFPFEVQFEGARNITTVLFIGNNCALIRTDHGSEYSIIITNEEWQFPKDSPYLQPQAEDDRPEWVKDDDTIRENRQRWEDMGRPWGRLKRNAELISHNGNIAYFVDYEPNYGKNGGVVSDEKQEGGLLQVKSHKQRCILSDKTLLNLDDWLEPEKSNHPYPTKGWPEPVEICKFCKGKKELKWKNERYDSSVSARRPVIHIMPCPYCQPERFKCTD